MYVGAFLGMNCLSSRVIGDLLVKGVTGIPFLGSGLCLVVSFAAVVFLLLLLDFFCC
jgi:hypothetical protein